MSRPRLQVDLDSPPAELKQKFEALQTLEDVAGLLEVRESDLVYVLYKRRPEAYYRRFSIAKRNGSLREILAPGGSLGILQRKLSQVLRLIYAPKPSTHGFVEDRNILTNAKQHTNKRWVANVDLKDFFPSINFGRVRAMFGKGLKLGTSAATALAQLCTVDGRLPQGAPTSPIISNMICRKLDNDLQSLAKHMGCHYTRYADDLTFSTNARNFRRELVDYVEGEANGRVGAALLKALTENGFQPNNKKVWLFEHSHRQVVTGLTVNKFPNVKRSFIQNVRATLHNIDKLGYETAEAVFRKTYAASSRYPGKGPPLLSEHIRGRIEFIGMVKGKRSRIYRKFRIQLAELLPNNSLVDLGIPMEVSDRPDVFICHASVDKGDIVEPLVRQLRIAGISYWYDAEAVGWGDDLTAVIQEGLNKSKLILVVLSPQSVGKKWQEREINTALTQELVGGGKVLPLMVGSRPEIRLLCKQYAFLAAKHYKEWHGGEYKGLIEDLKLALSRLGSSPSEA